MRQKMNKRIKAKWLKALRSGKYAQAVNTLVYKSYYHTTYCCLGVLRHCIHPKSNLSGDNHGNLLHQRHLKETGLSHKVQLELASMNDSGLSFLSIAKWIEKNL